MICVSIVFQGIWIGMQLGVILQSLMLAYVTWTTDWNEQVGTLKTFLIKNFIPLLLYC